MTDNPGYTADFIKSDTDQATYMADPALDHLMTALVSFPSDERPPTGYRRFRRWWDYRWNQEVWRNEYASIHFPTEIGKLGFHVREAKQGVLFFGRVHATRKA
ncbi:hypothetical protein [Candidatus Foliamicus sp.]